MKRLLSMGILVLLFAPTLHAETRAYPVPWVAKDNTDIVFTDLPGAGSIKIFTVSGEEVTTLPIAQGQNQLHWSVVNSSGRKLSSGVYFYLVDGNGGETKGKLVVIR
ncbi:MAG: T9SS type A sorting domain-containing protein [Elusimicrobia bacterium]|nr:T9SS type A sorting domain-containing protein [Elusimicrobiota bacterium]